jgi:MFS family permease
VPDEAPATTIAGAASARWLLLTILTVSYGAGAFGMLGISPLLPSLVEGFALTRLQVALVVPSIYLGGLLFSLPGGRLADRIGVRRSLLGGMAVGAAGLLIGASAPSFAIFLLCLVLAGTGWSVVNPALGKAIMDLFPARERGTAMGIKQMGLTAGGFVAALVLPVVASTLGWRAAIVTCAVVAGLPVVLAWPPLGRLEREPPARVRDTTATTTGWWWLRRPALLLLFAGGLGFGMVQAAVLSYLPLYAVQALAFDTIGAGMLVAASQAGGAVSRLTLGAASDRWLAGRRSVWLAAVGACAAAIFLVYAVWPVAAPLAAAALAFVTGVGAYGWVGVFFVISAEAGGARHAGLLSGVAFASIVAGLLVGPSAFGLLLVAWDSYAAPWTAFSALAALVAVTMLLAGRAIDRSRA